MLASISSTFTDQVASHGVYAVFVLMLIDAVFPAASELVMLYAGAVASGVFASAHHVSLFGAKLGYGIGAFIAMALAGAIGYFVGALLGWAIGRYGGRPLLERRGAWFHLSAERLDRAERWFVKWGNFGVLVGRVTPVVRSFVSIPAGVFEMPLAPYALYSFVGSSVWAFSIAGFGYGLGSSYKRFDHVFKYLEYAVVAGVLVLAAYLVFRWFNAARVRRRADPAG
jgi:membrane protein DedA with SNARE-associated domain